MNQNGCYEKIEVNIFFNDALVLELLTNLLEPFKGQAI